MSGVRVELHPEAQSEIRSAALWHEERRAGLGDEFMGEVSKGLWRVEQGPASFPVWPGTGESSVPIRKAVLDRFPYLIAFEAHHDQAFVLPLRTRRGARSIGLDEALSGPANFGMQPSARTLRAAPSGLRIAIRFLSHACGAIKRMSVQPSPRASSRVRLPLIRSPVSPSL